MRRLRLGAALLFAWSPAAAGALAVERPGMMVASVVSAAVFAVAPGLRAVSLAPSLSVPMGPTAELPSSAVSVRAVAAESPSAAPAAIAVPAPVSATENAVIRSPRVEAGLSALRAASYPESADVARIVAAIKARHPQLPISAENLFLVRDLAMLQRLEIPEGAAGAARIVSDGRREVPVVILVAGRGVSLDDFVEFAVHESVHLMDDGILRVNHDQELKHFFAEGWTQKRAVELANAVLADLDRPLSPGHAYHKEIALIESFANAHGSAALDELVRTGSDAGLRAALGGRWELAGRLASAPVGREKRLNALIALVNANRVDAADERALLDYVGL